LNCTPEKDNAAPNPFKLVDLKANPIHLLRLAYAFFEICNFFLFL
jgi:hypothetical protein